MNKAEEAGRLERELIRAISRRDLSFLEKIPVADSTVITPFGGSANKAARLKFDEKSVSESITTDEIQARIVGDSAIVTGRATIKSRGGDLNLSGQYRFTRVYHKRENWRIVTYQTARVEQ
jgi:ketosteroid isomerase-like protein